MYLVKLLIILQHCLQYYSCGKPVRSIIDKQQQNILPPNKSTYPRQHIYVYNFSRNANLDIELLNRNGFTEQSFLAVRFFLSKQGGSNYISMWCIYCRSFSFPPWAILGSLTTEPPKVTLSTSEPKKYRSKWQERKIGSQNPCCSLRRQRILSGKKNGGKKSMNGGGWFYPLCLPTMLWLWWWREKAAQSLCVCHVAAHVLWSLC